jgi:hypothetical protein
MRLGSNPLGGRRRVRWAPDPGFATDELLTPLSAGERTELVGLLSRVVDHHARP